MGIVFQAVSLMGIVFQAEGSHFWNKLPCDITGIHHCNAFKIHLKQFLINTEVFQPLE